MGTETFVMQQSGSVIFFVIFASFCVGVWSEAPTSTTLYLVRRGQTDFDEKGWYDCMGVARLTSAGQEYANEIAYRLRNITVDAVYTSILPVGRTTTQPLCSQRRLRQRDTDKFREIIMPHLQQKFYDHKSLVMSEGKACDICESLAGAYERVRAEVARIVPLHAGKNIIICADSEILLFVRMAIHGFDYKDKDLFYQHLDDWDNAVLVERDVQTSARGTLVSPHVPYQTDISRRQQLDAKKAQQDEERAAYLRAEAERREREIREEHEIQERKRKKLAELDRNA